ncbi:YqhA family protein [Thiomicrorhabdus sp. zzn3]|uniref:YqhA family protein n=1 Tax=Thiomicrorhabdus sp. zzn3 TaxID=3039775 RepID=UPI0024373F3D|nr:YqhA family protein [Thiomicrorhabdus sp. zzn3]MDG6777342.1 YqhA family protein [Thiomicrorhabdus sp. zzn3]
MQTENSDTCDVPVQRSKAEAMLESFLWNSRFVVLVAVVASLLTAFAVFYLTMVDVFYTIAHLTHYHELDDAGRAMLKAQTVAHVVGSVDGFLLGAIMLIFSLGLYELFISKIDDTSGSCSSKILIINSLDDLKDKLAKVILMILIVMFFEQAIFLKPTAPLELLYYSLAIMLVALALYLSHKAYSH